MNAAMSAFLFAAGLHDDLLPRLFRVHLLGQVLRQQLATGQLLAMEDDLPTLIRATEEASETAQSQIAPASSVPRVSGCKDCRRISVVW